MTMNFEDIFRPDFSRLALLYDEFADVCLVMRRNGKYCVDWKHPDAVRLLTKYLFFDFFNLKCVLPADRLCPTIPLRVNYIRWLGCLLQLGSCSAKPHLGKSSGQVFGIDIGVGASCVYPLLGARMYGWSFLGTEVDPVSIATARINVEKNLPDLETLFPV